MGRMATNLQNFEDVLFSNPFINPQASRCTMWHNLEWIFRPRPIPSRAIRPWPYSAERMFGAWMLPTWRLALASLVWSVAGLAHAATHILAHHFGSDKDPGTDFVLQTRVWRTHGASNSRFTGYRPGAPWSTTLGECRYHEERKPRIFRFSERQTEGLKPSPTLQASKWVRLKIDQHGKNLLKRAISCDQDPSDFGEFPEILARSRWIGLSKPFWPRLSGSLSSFVGSIAMDVGRVCEVTWRHLAVVFVACVRARMYPCTHLNSHTVLPLSISQSLSLSLLVSLSTVSLYLSLYLSTSLSVCLSICLSL